MGSLIAADKLKTRSILVKRFNYVMEKITLLEKKIETNYVVGDIKVRTTGKTRQLILKKVDFLEFNEQVWVPTTQESIEPSHHLSSSLDSEFSKKCATYRKGRRLLYCNYKCVCIKNQKELILIEKYPLLMASGYSRKKIIKALNMLSEILSCSRELKNISLLLHLAWQTGVKI